MARRRTESQLTAEVQRNLLEVLETGVHRRTAAAACRITEATLHRWLEHGRKDELGGLDTVFARFRLEVQRVEAETQAHVVEKLLEAIERGDVKAIEAYLVRRWPKLWGYATKLRFEIEHDRKKVIALAKTVLCKRCIGKFIDALCELDSEDDESAEVNL